MNPGRTVRRFAASHVKASHKFQPLSVSISLGIERVRETRQGIFLTTEIRPLERVKMPVLPAAVD